MSSVMRQPLLMIPGPTDAPEEVLRRCGLPVFPHYEGDFAVFYDQLVHKMADVFGLTDGQVHLPIGSGTTAINMMLASLCTPDDSILIINNGYWGSFAERNASSLGIPYVSLASGHGTPYDADAVRAEMERGRHRFIYVTHNESAAAIVNPLPPLGQLAIEYDALLLVDSVSAVGGMVIDMDAAGADAVAGASQKCLELPPGLALVAVGSRARQYMSGMTDRRVPLLLDLMAWQESFETRHDWHPQPFTGAANLLYALDWMADQIREEGLANRQERFRAAGQRLKSGFSDLGFTATAGPRIASPVVTEFRMPDGRSAEDLRAYYLAEHNIMVGRGQGPETGPADAHIRVAHFGRSAEPERIDLLIDITRDFMG